MLDLTGLKRTPLRDIHRYLGAKMVPYAGFEMPVHYPTGILAEHRAVRQDVGIFDVSHMGEFEVTGPDRNAFVNRITCNDVSAIGPGGVQYSALLADNGTIVDDCTVYRFEDKIMLVVNAANIEKDWAHIVAQKGAANVRLKNISEGVGLLALQGPRSEVVLQPETEVELGTLAYYHFAIGKVAGRDCFVSRTGYTGEDGFELYCRSTDSVPIWEVLAGSGKALPIGLGARDSLRLEMGYALYGSDIDDTTTPLEAGLGWIVQLDKGAPFTGQAALLRQKLQGLTRKLVGFTMPGKAFPRHGYPVFVDGNKVDIVRSGTLSPSLGVPIGTTYLPLTAARLGTSFEIECRGPQLPAQVVKKPFWTKGTVGRR